MKTEVNRYISRHRANFETNPTYLSTVIPRLLPETQPSPGRFGWIRKFNSAGIGVIVGR